MVLLLPDAMVGARVQAALAWLAGIAGRESSWALRLRSLLINGRAQPVEGFGWPWFPESASWVTPTCFGLLALEKANRARHSPALRQRCSEAREYLLLHRCRDGGWNHGSTKALGYDSDSYPETTGQALLALHGVSGEKLAGALACARAHLARPRSLEAMNWLQLGLLAHGQAVPDVPLPKSHGSVQEIALSLLLQAARGGRNVFLEWQ